MPVILAHDEESASSNRYRDIEGVEYEFPTMYRARVVPGDRFVYYRGTRRPGGGRGPAEYFGTGLIGEVAPSERAGHLYCEILDWRPLSPPVSFKRGDEHLEPGGVAGGRYYQQGVRTVSDEVLDAILREAGLRAPEEQVSGSAGGVYPGADHARAVDEIAVEIALATYRAQHYDASVQSMSHTNPGYDIAIREPSGEPRLYVEVKGTVGPRPRFHMSEGQRRFSELRGALYRLFVVYSIDLEARTGASVERSGPLTATEVRLEAEHWRGEVLSPDD